MKGYFLQTSLINSTISFECTDGFKMPAYWTRPSNNEKLAGIVFVYEAFGMNAEMQRLADSFALEGFSVLMPDLFSRGTWFKCIRQLMTDLKAEKGQGIDDLISARKYLANTSSIDDNQIAVIGLCMGGGFALVLSKTGLFQIAAPFYGKAPKSLKGSCPIVGSYGALDKVTKNDLIHLQNEVTKNNIHSDIKIYPNAGHSFMNKAPNIFLSMLTRVLPSHSFHVPEAEDDARQRVVQFFKNQIKK